MGRPASARSRLASCSWMVARGPAASMVASRPEAPAAAGCAAGDTLQGARGWRQRGQIESRRARQVEDQLGLAARGGHHRDPPPPWPARPLAAREHLDHLIHVAYLDGAMGAQNGGEDARLAGEAARVAGDGAPRALRPADLENNDGLAAIRRAVEGGHEAPGLAH